MRGTEMKAIRKGSAGFVWALVASFTLLVSGCATQASVIDLELGQERIKFQQSQIQDRMRELDEVFKRGSPTSQSDQTDLIIRLDELYSELQLLQGKLEETTYMTSELSQRLDDDTFRGKELTERLDILDRHVMLLKESFGQLVQSAPNGSSSKKSETAVIEPGPPKDKSMLLPGRATGENRSSSLSPSEAYGLAYNDFLKGNYDLALIGFQSFLSQYENTSLGPNAQYWVGESYNGKKEFRKAIEAFQLVVEKYPDSNKVPGSLLKTGYSYIQLADMVRAEEYLKKVVEDHPFSDEAALAKNRLAELK